jgi:ribosomal protein S27AE
LAHDRNRIVTLKVEAADMDIDALHSTLLSITVVSEKLRLARENLPTNGNATSPLETLLCEVEGDLRMAKATLAGELGFRLCSRCWPPELVATDRDGRVNCPSCGHISFEQAA